MGCATPLGAARSFAPPHFFVGAKTCALPRPIANRRHEPIGFPAADNRSILAHDAGELAGGGAPMCEDVARFWRGRIINLS
jgi:hypothetical protein